MASNDAAIFENTPLKSQGKIILGRRLLGEEVFNSDSRIASFNSIALDSTGPAGVNRIRP